MGEEGTSGGWGEIQAVGEARGEERQHKKGEGGGGRKQVGELLVKA